MRPFLRDWVRLDIETGILRLELPMLKKHLRWPSEILSTTSLYELLRKIIIECEHREMRAVIPLYEMCDTGGPKINTILLYE